MRPSPGTAPGATTGAMGRGAAAMIAVELVRTAILSRRLRRRRDSGSVIVYVEGEAAFLQRLEDAGLPSVSLRPPLPALGSASARIVPEGRVDVLVGDASPWAFARIAAGVRGDVALRVCSVHGRLGSYGGVPYYPPVYAEEILAARVRHPAGYFVPAPEHRLPVLLYHVCYHLAEASGLATGCALATGEAGYDYAARIRAVAAAQGSVAHDPLTLTSIHEDLVRLEWDMPLDLLIRWPARTPWIDLLETTARMRARASATAFAELVVVILRGDLPAHLESTAVELLGEHFDVLEHGPLSDEQSLRVRRRVRGGSWRVRDEAAPAWPTRYVLCTTRPHEHGAAGGTPVPLNCKRIVREALRRAGRSGGCRHALHASDAAAEAHVMLDALFGRDAPRRRAELAELSRARRSVSGSSAT